MASDNKSLGRFMLEGIPPAPRGMPQVEVTFDVDANGILNVKAKDKTSGKEQSIRIEARSSLSKDDIDRMQKEAELHAEEDKKKHEMVEIKNVAESLVYTAEKALKDNGDKVPADIKKDVEEKIADVKKLKDGDDLDALKKSTEALSEHMQKIGEAMAKEASIHEEAKAAPEGEQKDTPPEGKVHDV